MTWLRWFIVIGLFCGAVQRCEATTLSVSGQPEHIEASTPFEVDVSFSGSKSGCGNKSYYLVGLFSKSGNDLFGFTASSSGAWIDRTQPPQQAYMFTASEEGSWSGKLRVKANIDDDGFTGAGTYQFRVDRFTSTGTTKAESSNTVSIFLDYVPPATPTPTPSPQATTPATAGPTQTPTPATAGLTPHPSTMPTPKPSPSTTQLGATMAGQITYAPSGSVAGVATTIEADSSPVSSSRLIPWLILGGSLLVAGGVIPFGWKLLRDTIDG